MSKKVNIYYKTKLGKHFYMFSTTRYKTVKEALKNSRKLQSYEKRAFSKKYGEPLVLKRMYGSFK